MQAVGIASSLKRPAAQDEQTVAPVWSLNWPAPQSLQLASEGAPSCDMLVPGLHGRGTIVPGLQKWPAEHGAWHVGVM